MSKSSEETTKGRDLLSLLNSQIQKSLEESRLTFQKAATLRSYFEKYEEPIRLREERIRSGPPKGRRFKQLLSECMKVVAEASSLHNQVRKREQAALSHFQNAIAGIRDLSENTDVEPPAGVMESLEKSARLRSAEFECLDGVIQNSHMIVNLPPHSTPVQLYTLLEQRRKYMDRVGTMMEEAEKLERNALGLAEAPMPRAAASEEGPVEQEGGGGMSELEDREWDEWLRHAREDSGELDLSLTDKDVDGVTQEEAVVVKSEKPEEKPMVEPAKKAPPVPKTGTMLEGFEALEQEVRGLRDLAERERTAAETEATTKLARLREEHDRALSDEVRARRDAEKQAREREAEREEVKKLLAAEKENLAEQATAFAAEKAETENKAEAARGELKKEIEELGRKQKNLEGSIASTEEAMKKLREETAGKVTEIEAERKKLAEDREAANEEVRSANQERDEALVLVTSLTRRLNTPGVKKP